MRTEMQVISIPQVDGVTRLLALSGHDAALVRRDRTMIDCVRSYACLDIDRAGVMTWWRPTGCEDTNRGREAIRDEIEAEQGEEV